MAKKSFKHGPKKNQHDKTDTKKQNKKEHLNKKMLVVSNVIFILLISGLLIIGLSQFFTTTTMEAHPKIAGNKGNLTAEFSQNSFQYKINIDPGSGGGIGFGFINTADSLTGSFSNKTEKSLYLKGLGSFQENIGLLLNSYKDKYYTISADTTRTGDIDQRTKVEVHTHVDLVPWWPIGMEQDYKITVKLTQKGGAQKVIIEQLQVQIWRNIDTNQTRFLEKAVLYTKEPNAELTEEGQEKVFKTSIALEEDYDLVGLLSYVKIIFIDSNGDALDNILVSNIAEVNPGKHVMPLALTINLRVLNEEQTTKLGMLLASFPLSIVSLLIGIMGALVFSVYIRRPGTVRKAGYAILIAAILQILAVWFLYTGLESLVNVMDGVLKVNLRENFHWSPMLYLMYAAGALMLISAILILIYFKVPKKEKTQSEEKDTFQVVSQ